MKGEDYWYDDPIFGKNWDKDHSADKPENSYGQLHTGTYILEWGK